MNLADIVNTFVGSFLTVLSDFLNGLFGWLADFLGGIHVTLP